MYPTSLLVSKYSLFSKKSAECHDTGCFCSAPLQTVLTETRATTMKLLDWLKSALSLYLWGDVLKLFTCRRIALTVFSSRVR